MDLLAPFFERFALSARTFYSGAFCGISPNLNGQAGYLHVLKKGRLTITHPNARRIVVDRPSIIFLPRPHDHRLHAAEEGTELVCAVIEFGAGMLNPLTASFPQPFVIPLDSLPALAPTLELLFAESASDLPGRQVALDRLFEYILVLLFRSAINLRLVDSGVMLGLGDPRLSRAIELMHEHPETSWSLEQLAQQAGMSRARFAAHFHKVVGVTPFDYLTNWRLGIAQTMLRKGNSLKLIATAVGYGNATALPASSPSASELHRPNGYAPSVRRSSAESGADSTVLTASRSGRSQSPFESSEKWTTSSKLSRLNLNAGIGESARRAFAGG